MSNAEIRGRFVWHELMTADPDAAGTFYSNVIPWKTQPSGMPSYTLWMSGKNRAGGLMSLPEEGAGQAPRWMVYIGAPDIDATVAAAQRLGGKVHKETSDIPNVGRFAVLSDPQGAEFLVFSPNPGSQDGAPSTEVGDFTWHELATIDPEAALRFYGELFGWKKGASHDMGAMGTYQIISHQGQDVGGVYSARDVSTPPSWLAYVRVPDAGKAASAVKAGGGRVLHGPVEVPGGSWIVMAIDPQGATFAVVESPAVARKPAAASPGAKSTAKAASEPQGSKSPPTGSAAGKQRTTTAGGGRGTPSARDKPATAKRATPKRAAAKRTGAKRSAAKRATAKRATTKRASAKRATAKRTAAAKRPTRTAAKRTRVKSRSTSARGRPAGRTRSGRARSSRSGARKRK